MSFKSKTIWVCKIHIVVLLYSSRTYSTAEPLKKIKVKKRKKERKKERKEGRKKSASKDMGLARLGE